MKSLFSTTFLICLGLLPGRALGQTTRQTTTPTIWVFTYLKANAGRKADLRTFVERNWFAMDSVAVKQGLFKTYELYENQSPENSAWDFLVAVQYFTANRYADVAERFEQIRQKHTIVPINGRTFKELGSVIGSDTVVKHEYQSQPTLFSAQFHSPKKNASP